MNLKKEVEESNLRQLFVKRRLKSARESLSMYVRNVIKREEVVKTIGKCYDLWRDAPDLWLQGVQEQVTEIHRSLQRADAEKTRHNTDKKKNKMNKMQTILQEENLNLKKEIEALKLELRNQVEEVKRTTKKEIYEEFKENKRQLNLMEEETILRFRMFGLSIEVTVKPCDGELTLFNFDLDFEENEKEFEKIWKAIRSYDTDLFYEIINDLIMEHDVVERHKEKYLSLRSKVENFEFGSDE